MKTEWQVIFKQLLHSTGSQAHEWESLLRHRNIINKGLYEDLSDRYSGVKISNKDTSEFLTLCSSLNLGRFLSIFVRFMVIPASFSSGVVC